MSSDWTDWSDEDLMAGVGDGHRAAFAELVARHQRPLLNFFYRLAGNAQAAEDGAQEVFLRLFAHAATYRPEAKFTTFLYRVARNFWIDQRRAWKRTVSLDAPSKDGAEDSRGDRTPAPAAGPLDRAMRRESEEALVRAIGQLPEEHRMVLVLSEMVGLKYQEIAEILDVPVGTVKSRMHSAVDKLKVILMTGGRE